MTTAVIADDAFDANRACRASSTFRELSEGGSALASTPPNVMPRAGRPSVIMNAALTTATTTARFVTNCVNLYHEPSSTPRVPLGGALPAGGRQRVDPRPEHGEQCGERNQCGADGHQRADRTAETHRVDEGERHDA